MKSKKASYIIMIFHFIKKSDKVFIMKEDTLKNKY